LIDLVKFQKDSSILSKRFQIILEGLTNGGSINSDWKVKEFEEIQFLTLNLDQKSELKLKPISRRELENLPELEFLTLNNQTYEDVSTAGLGNNCFLNALYGIWSVDPYPALRAQNPQNYRTQLKELLRRWLVKI
jgi:hypothetical protein